LFLEIRDKNLKEEFLLEVKLFVPTWDEVYVKIFPKSLMESIITALEEAEKETLLTNLVRASFENYRDNKDAAVYFYKNMHDKQWYKNANLSEEKELITLVHILDVTFKGVENHFETIDNKKTNKQVFNILFKEKLITNYIDNVSPETITRVYTLVNDVKDLDPAEKMMLRNFILERHPGFKFLGSVEKETATKGLIVTMACFEAKQKTLAHIMEEEVPQNSREIAFALSLGDLRENAEYKAAKEKQEILNSTVAKLKDEIDRAQLFDPSTVTVSRASFGTKVTLLNEATDGTESYTLLGPWESDPNNKIISYLSPFGGALMNKKRGEKFTFTIADSKVSYVVKDIEAAL
jgi:transcription elongation factor GreA